MTKRIQYVITQAPIEDSRIHRDYGWKCRVCGFERGPLFCYRANALAEAREHMKELHGDGEPDRKSPLFERGLKSGSAIRTHPISPYLMSMPSYRAGYEEGEAARLALQNDPPPTPAEREELDSLGSSNA